jgi:integrase
MIVNTPILKKLGIRYRRPYQMRHTNASMRLTAGQTVGYAAAQMGHSPEMFVKRYAKWIDGAHNRIEDDKLEALLMSPASEPQEALHGFISGVAVGTK